MIDLVRTDGLVVGIVGLVVGIVGLPDVETGDVARRFICAKAAYFSRA
jgi:hypothetical protein